MSKPRGRTVAITPYRQLVCDLMHFSAQVPAVCAERRMNLTELVQSRSRTPSKPSYTTIFAKAYGILSREYPELRRSYLKLPWPRFYEHPHSIVALNVERRLPEEDVVLFCLVRAPENRSFEEIEAIVRHHREAPITELRSHQRAVGVSRIPWPVRPLFWHLSLNLFGRRRCHNFGTFSLSSIGSQGAGLLNIKPILTTAIHYGMLEKDHSLNVRLTWDHRVFDGATAARALTDLERILTVELVRELGSPIRLAA